ncbi:FAD-dependent oxidoreductase [Motilimonas sp. 1_MG-2023]|uniref:NAD(P)/FAD-dependent oxidoreductase n=1 Tax=Motilimonas sp. 1_MG-2023 TaxID=3062672 RepID=UPI0026E2DB9C|nr:FAD-dependent oxidoreductase [Motilimonas sp. 1_MG-2023]MDO6526071.1 FAD-dependent oxidoreductase [Motilimonas sp. 1_MG-2023]
MKKVAIVGTGISGLVSAYLLNREHDIQVFEANDYIGGHTATVDVEVDGRSWAIDTGFIVFNDRTYPNFERLLALLGVQAKPTEMSFSVNNVQTGLEYNGHNLDTLFAQRSNILNPKFWRFIAEIMRFNGKCKALWAQQSIDPELTLGDFLKQQNFSEFFAEHYILPMGAAIWSSSLVEMEQFSLLFFIRFFHNHGLLNVSDRPQWYVIEGGSRNYIEPLVAEFKDKIHLNTAVSKIERGNEGVVLTLNNGQQAYFDEVVLACHSDQSLAMLSDATEQEQKILGDLAYSENDVVLHTDTRLLPKRKKAWAAWNYQLNGQRDNPASVTYDMNILQNLPADAPTFCVTLNQNHAIDPSKILRSFKYMHPVFNQASLAAQQNREQICGRNHTHFAGAYWYNGFHEDGVRSALDVCQRFGLKL